MTEHRRKHADFNENWEAEIAAYDEECSRQERDYREHFMVITREGDSALTEEENEILGIFLNGMSCKEIARQYNLDEDTIDGMLEIIRAKLSLE